MKFIIDSYPDYCPNCGVKLRNDGADSRRFQLEDFNLGASSQCKCGACFQYVPGAEITKLAIEHGDAGQYW